MTSWLEKLLMFVVESISLGQLETHALLKSEKNTKQFKQIFLQTIQVRVW